MYFLSIRIFEQLALALKNRVALKFFAVWNILFIFRIVEQLALTLKNRGCLNSLNWMYFFYSGFLSNLRLPWKTEGALKFFAVLNIFFIVLEFWVTCACPENRVALNLLYWMHIFYYSRRLSNLRLPWKTELPWNFHCTEIYFIIQDFWATCACPENTAFPEIFQAPGGARPPPTPRLVRLWV